MPQVYIQTSDGLRTRWPVAYPALPPDDDGTYTAVAPVDMLTNPDTDTLAQQVARLAPRGRAWNTDEAATTWGTRVQHGVWRLIAAGLVSVYLALTRVKNAAFPGQTDIAALEDWEAQHGLPDPCGDLSDQPAQRRRAVQAARILMDGFSRHDMLRLLIRAGAPSTVTVTERRGFECGWSECGAAGLEGADSNHKFYITGQQIITWLECGGNSISSVPLGALGNSNMLCVINRAKHAHTLAIFENAGAP